MTPNTEIQGQSPTPPDDETTIQIDWVVWVIVGVLVAWGLAWGVAGFLVGVTATVRGWV